MQAPGFSRPSPEGLGSPSPPFFAGPAVSQLENRPKQHHKLDGKDKCDEQTFHGQHLFSRQQVQAATPAVEKSPAVSHFTAGDADAKLDFVAAPHQKSRYWTQGGLSRLFAFRTA